MTGLIQDIEGENSYTLLAWIKPSDLGGNKFLWGQTNQGIHNGIRNGGFLPIRHTGELTLTVRLTSAPLKVSGYTPHGSTTEPLTLEPFT